MMLSDKEIIFEIVSGSMQIQPFKKMNLGPVSYDLTIGKICTSYGECKNDLQLFPGVAVGVTTKESITLLPKTRIAGLLSMRSGPTRKGLFASFSHLVDPGYSGKLNLVVQTVKPFKLCIGDSICQIMFFRTGDILKGWTGKGKEFSGKL